MFLSLDFYATKFIIMKLILKFSMLAIVVMLFALGCQKTSLLDESGNVIKGKGFNAASAKLWYYKEFVNSAEYASSKTKEQGKQIPIWKNGYYHTYSDLEIIEFPIIKEKKKFPIPNNANMTLNDRKRLANASLSRILFIKDKTGKISVREADYIPSWDYAVKKNYDISSVAYGKQGDDFTGMLIIKKYNGDYLSIRGLSNGTIDKSINLENKNEISNTSNLDGCETTTVCLFIRECIVHGDGYEECTEWANTEICMTFDDCGGGDDCGNMTPEACACELYGVCGEVIGDVPPDACAPEDSNPAYVSFLSNIAITNSSPMTAGSSIIINSTQDKKPVSWDVVSGVWGKVSSIETMTRELKMVGNNLIWTISDFDHATHSLSKGIFMSAGPHNVELPLISFTPNLINPLAASMQAVGRLEFSFCGIHISARDYNINETQTIHAYD